MIQETKYSNPTLHVFNVGLYTEQFYDIIPTLFPLLLADYPYILLHCLMSFSLVLLID